MNISNLSDEEMEEKLREFFEANFSYLKENSGHTINLSLKEKAFEQVLCYWKKEKFLAGSKRHFQEKVSLHGLHSPNKQIPFSMEDKVDVIENQEGLSLFHLTSKSRENILADKEKYSRQLAFCTQIWDKTYPQKPVSKTGMLSTSVPKEVHEALRSGDEKAAKEAIENWEPLIDIPFSEEDAKALISDFGQVVEKTDADEFAPPAPEVLESIVKGTNKTFARQICLECDLRHSCPSFDAYQGINDPLPQEDSAPLLLD